MIGIRAQDWVAHHAEHRPHALALRCAEDGLTVTWGELGNRVGRLTDVLHRSGVGKGDRIAVVAENDPRVFEAQFAAMRLGALLVPLNWRLAAAELVEICLDAEPLVMLYDGDWADVATTVSDRAGIAQRITWGADPSVGASGYEERLAAATPRAARADLMASDPTHILYTSGTTGTPKGVLLTHSTLIANAIHCAHAMGVAQPGCHHLNPMPLFHAGGLNGMSNPILYFGGTVTTMARFVPGAVLDALSGSTPPTTHLNAIPLMYQMLADLPGFADADLSTMRVGAVAGAIAGPQLLQLWADRGVALQPQYGGTETGPLTITLDDELAGLDKAKKGSVGRPVLHCEVRLVGADGTDVSDGVTGEIWLRGPNITVGYWRKNRADFFTDDWYRTGDAAYRDPDGYYYIAGRTKEMYKSGGENVYPAEVERVLAVHPDVVDVAVVSAPDPTWSEVGVAVVVPRPGTAPTLDELAEFAGAQLARYKLPQRVVLVAELPRNVTGKVQRQALKDQYGRT